MLRFFRLSSKDLPLLLGWSIVLAGLWLALHRFQTPAEQYLEMFDLSFQDVCMILVFFVLFFVIIRSLDAFVLTPYLAFFEYREAATDGRLKAAADIDMQAAATVAQIDEQIAKVRMQAYRQRIQTLQNAKQKAQSIVAAAETHAAELLAKEREKIAADAEQSRQRLNTEIEHLAASLATQIERASQDGRA
jgi:F0F1-type ATP synthase membrane subunit b/b'